MRCALKWSRFVEEFPFGSKASFVADQAAAAVAGTAELRGGRSLAGVCGGGWPEELASGCRVSGDFLGTETGCAQASSRSRATSRGNVARFGAAAGAG